MEIVLEGRINMIYPEISGVSKAGNEWRKREIVIETLGAYPRKVKITFFGDRSDMPTVHQEGDEVSIWVDIESREFNGRWYTEVNAYRIEAGIRSQKQSGNASVAMNNVDSLGNGAPNFDAMPKSEGFYTENNADDLPF